MKVLDKSWINCIRMWEWVSEHLPDGFCFASPKIKEFIVDALKSTWLRENGFIKPLSCDCFFCDYDKKHGDRCGSCPARLVESGFHCNDKGSSFRYDPINFCQRIIKLNKIRLGESK